MSLADSLLGVPGDLGADDHSEVAEGLIEHLLIDLRVQVPNEYVGPHILGALILRSLVDLDGLPVQFDHMHDLDRIIRILLTLELYKSISLMLIGDLIPRDVNIDHWSALREQLPKYVFVDLLVDVARIDRGFLVALIERWDEGHLL